MVESAENVERPILTVAAVWTGELQCPLCSSRLSYAFPGVTRKIEDLNRVILLRGHYYSCNNEQCYLNKPFRAPQSLVLPYKKFSRAVQEKIIRIHHEVGNNFEQIRKTLQIFSTVKISHQTIYRYLEDFLYLQSDRVDQTIKLKVQQNQSLVIIVDGQRPKRNSPALWDFYDLISGEHIHTEYLKKADHQVLGQIFQKIQQKFGVPIEAVISDHQKSIEKAVRKYLPKARHQYCHFHFLQNLSAPLSQMDSHLHAQLEATINHIYISSTSIAQIIQIVPGHYQTVQSFFTPISQDLKSLLQHPSRSFDTWGGVETFEALIRYIGILQQELLPMVSVQSRIGKILTKTVAKLKSTIEDNANLYAKLRFLIKSFDEIREILGTKAYSKVGMRSVADNWIRSIKKILKKNGKKLNENAAIKLLSYRTSIDEVFIQWIRLYSHHRRGLFEFLDDFRMSRTSTPLEKEFSSEVGEWRGLAGKGRVDYYVQLKGDQWLKTHSHYDPKEIQCILNEYSIKTHQKCQTFFSDRRKNERSTWHRPFDRLDGIELMKKQIKKVKKLGRIMSA